MREASIITTPRRMKKIFVQSAQPMRSASQTPPPVKKISGTATTKAMWVKIA
jgi:hypothetical protein